MAMIVALQIDRVKMEKEKEEKVTSYSLLPASKSSLPS